MNWLNENNGFLMVILTSVYVVATIIICWANLKSAKASREQTAEQKRQFEAINRPQIDVSLEIIRSNSVALKVENTGTKYAHDVNVEINDDFIDQIENQKNRELLVKISTSTYNVGIRQKWYIFICGTNETKILDYIPLQAQISYSDGKQLYEETIKLDFSQYSGMQIYESPIEDIRHYQKNLAENSKKELALLEKIHSVIKSSKNT